MLQAYFERGMTDATSWWRRALSKRSSSPYPVEISPAVRALAEEVDRRTLTT